MPIFQEPSHWQHHLVKIPSGIKLHYVEVQPAPNDATDKAIILIHGFPQTWYAFRHMMQPLADEGYRVIGVDYRGAGASDKPRNGYDKMTMAKDIRDLYVDFLGIEKAVVFGHDIGSMVAVCLALQYPENVSKLVAAEAPQPGSKAYDLCTRDDRYTYQQWHFFFHSTPGLPEALTVGREREYIATFFRSKCHNAGFLTKDDLDRYADSYSHPGSMSAAFEVYRAFRADREAFQEHMVSHDKLKMPVLTIAWEDALIADMAEDMCREFATNVTAAIIPRADHYFPEENPSEALHALSRFLGS